MKRKKDKWDQAAWQHLRPHRNGLGVIPVGRLAMLLRRTAKTEFKRGWDARNAHIYGPDVYVPIPKELL